MNTISPPSIVQIRRVLASVLIHAVLLFPLWAGAQQSVQAEGQLPKVRVIQQERLATLREIYTVLRGKYGAGISNFYQLWAATRAVTEAELDLCSSDKKAYRIREVAGRGKGPRNAVPPTCSKQAPFPGGRPQSKGQPASSGDSA
jgi:hypothetical protein